MSSAYKSLIASDTKIKLVFPWLTCAYRLIFQATRVSSVLDKAVGKKHLTDGNPETCWTSQQVCYSLRQGL